MKNNLGMPGHSAVQEKKFAQKLYIGIGIAIVTAAVAFFFLGRKQNIPTPANPQQVEAPANSSSEPQPLSEQPKSTNE